MKKIFFILTLLALFVSCEDDVRFYNPGLQAYRDDFLFRGVGITATKDASGKITIRALAEDQALVLNTSNSNVGTYYLGTTNQDNKATYMSSFEDNELFYETEIFNGPVSKIAPAIVSAGSGYETDCTLVDGEYLCNSSHETTGGTGNGLKVSIVANASGAVTSARVASPGTNYLPGDVVTIVGGNGLARCRVLNIEGSNGEIEITNSDGTRISGKFKFNARKTNSNPNGLELVNFQYGEFYNLPVNAAP